MARARGFADVADLSDRQLADVVRYVARLCLEVERGLRPPDHLLQLMDRATLDRFRRAGRLGRFTGGPVTRHDLGPPHLARPADGRVEATITTRTDRGRWGALLLRLQRHDDRWTVGQIQRLLATGHYRPPTRQPSPSELPLELRQQRLAEERTLAEAALTATRRRLQELTRGGPGYAMTATQARTWQHVIRGLDREAVQLRSRIDARHARALARHQ